MGRYFGHSHLMEMSIISKFFSCSPILSACNLEMCVQCVIRCFGSVCVRLLRLAPGQSMTTTPNLSVFFSLSLSLQSLLNFDVLQVSSTTILCTFSVCVPSHRIIYLAEMLALTHKSRVVLLLLMLAR